MAVTMLPGQSLVFTGAAVSVPSGTYWVWTITAVNGSGASLGVATQVQDNGSPNSQSGLSYTLGPLNVASGTDVYLSGSLQPYSDAGHTTTNGSAVTATSGLMATVQASVAAPGNVSDLSASYSGDLVTVSWSAASNSPYYEVQVLDSDGAVESVPTAQVSAPGGQVIIITDDTYGQEGAFVPTTSASVSLGAGFTGSIQVRGASAAGSMAVLGSPSTVTVSTPAGSPDIIVSSVSGYFYTTGDYYPSTGYTQRVPGVGMTITLYNAGAGAGSMPAVGFSAVVVGADGLIYATTNYEASTEPIQPGQSLSFTFPPPIIEMQEGPVPTNQTYTIYVAMGQGYAEQAAKGYAAFSELPGSVSAVVGGGPVSNYPANIRVRQVGGVFR